MSNGQKTATIRIQRFNPDKDKKPYMDEFQVPLDNDPTLLDASAADQNDNGWQCHL